MLLLWDVSLASVSGGMGEEEGRVAASFKPSFLQAGALKGPSGRVGSRIAYLIHHLENKVWESTCDPVTCFF